jgi:hypothetical protein
MAEAGHSLADSAWYDWSIAVGATWPDHELGYGAHSMKDFSQEVLAIISSGEVDGNSFCITSGQLDRNLYTAVNEVLENLGGKWSRKLRGHVLDDDPTEKIDELLLARKTVNERQLYQFFETPAEIAKRVVELADIRKDMCILEPSAGRSALLDAIPANREIEPHWITAVELDPKHIPVLKRWAITHGK